MRNKLWIGAVLGVLGLAQAKSPVETYGPLSVSGINLVDSTGKLVTLRGMSLCGHYDQGCREFWIPSVLDYVLTDWHVSVVRAPVKVDNETISVSPFTIKGYLSDTLTAMNAIRKVIDGAIVDGLYIIVDWHTEGIHQTEANTFFGELAKEYGNTPNIIWEIYNEPNGPGWTGNNGIAAYAQSVITTIRKYSKNVVLVGNPSWDQQPDVPGTELNSFSNIAYTVHFYNDQTHWGTVTSARSKSHAVFASEWGMSDHTGGGNFQNVSTGNIGTWLGDLDSWGVSSCNWSLGHALANAGQGPGTETSAALATTAATAPSASTPWADADLTGDGLSIRGYLRSKNPTWTLADTTTKLIAPFQISSDKKTGFVYAVDSIEFAATYNKTLLWKVTETGRTSKAVYTTQQTSNSVSTQHIVGRKNAGSAAWKDETVDAVLSPVGGTVSYTITNTTSGLVRVQLLREIQVRWEGSRLLVPSNMIDPGAPVQVRIRNPLGQVLWQKNATMGAGSIELSQSRPRFPGVQILEVNSSSEIIRSNLAPTF